MSERTCSKCGETKPETPEFFSTRGHPCRGGLRPDCKTCQAERDRAYREKNREKIRARKAAYRLANLDAIKAKDAAYQRTERGKAARKRANAKYLATDAGRLVFATAQQKRRAAKAAASGDFTRDQWAPLVEDFDGECAYCGAAGDLTRDHVVPLARGGAHTARNIVPACRPCNSRKFLSDMETWFRTQPTFTEERLARVLSYIAQRDAA